jgi:TRAP-type C4-dicarboxylate transport system substrate-binding protein
MNSSSWNALPKDVKQIVEDLNDEWGLYTARFWDSTEKKALETLKAKFGIQVLNLNDDEVRKWMERLQTVVQDYKQRSVDRGLPGQEIINEIEEVVSE